MIPERGNVANSAMSVFFEDVNDIDVYIEDTAVGYSKLFSIIFSRLFEGEYKVDKVFPIGDRASVIEQHRIHVSTGRPSIYIIDGDLYILTGNDVESAIGLFKIPMYCIENILCDHEAIVEVLDEEDPVNDRSVIANQFNYKEWIDNNSDLLFELFIEYAISFEVNPGVQTVAYPVNKLVSSEKGNIAVEKIEKRISEIRDETILVVGEEPYASRRKGLIKKFGEGNKDKLSVVSGKDYVFPLLKMRARSVVKTQISDINLKQRIAKRCDLSDILPAKDYVLL